MAYTAKSIPSTARLLIHFGADRTPDHSGARQTGFSFGAEANSTKILSR